MIDVTRFPQNPIVKPNPEIPWQAKAAFNGCPVLKDDLLYLLYRAQSTPKEHQGQTIELSTIGIAQSEKDFNFVGHRPLIVPEYDWEAFGCEDPRVTEFDHQYYIFYTALSKFPPGPDSIKVAVAVSPDLKTISQKHLVTPFNAKAMVLFPEKVNNKITVMLAANTDTPPSEIAMIQFDKMEQLWQPEYWHNWYEHLDVYTLHLQRRPQDHIETGAPPIKTDFGWLLIYSYINNYQDNENRILTIEAALLDLENPLRIIGRSKFPLLIPEKDYEVNGLISEIVFPSGAQIRDNQLDIYYGGADTCCCLASCSMASLLEELKQ